MATFVSNRDAGSLTNEEGHFRFQTNVWEGNILEGMLVTENDTPNMTVLVEAGDIRIPYSTYAYTAWSDSDTSVTIATADTANPRIDRIVAYIDRAMDFTDADTNNPGALKFMAVAGTPGAIPSAVSNAAVDSAVGASNPWVELATVSVAANVTQITNVNITDTREYISLYSTDVIGNDQLQTDAVGTNEIQNSAVTAAKLGTNAVTPSKTNLFWIGSSTSSTNIGTSTVTLFNKTFTVPEACIVRVLWSASGNANVAGDPAINIAINGTTVRSHSGSAGLELLAAAVNEDFPFMTMGYLSVSAGSVTVLCRASHSVASGWDVSAGVVEILMMGTDRTL